MKKLLALFVMMLMAAPLFAANAITITAEDAGGGVLSVYYTVDAASEDDPVGMALNFSCSDAATTTSADIDNVDVRFPVYLDYAHDAVGPNFDPCTWDPCNPLYQVSDGNPLAKSDEAGVPAGAVSDFSICVGRLDQDAPAKGVAQKLCDIQLAQGSAAYTDVTIAADDLRGGVVGSVFAVTVPGAPVRVNFAVAKCMKETAPEYATWQAWGEPDCWCYDRQCRGNVDGKKTFLRYVSSTDLDLFKPAYNKNDAALALVPNGMCANLDHAKTFLRFVSSTDLDIFKLYYNKPDASVPVCDMTNYNFWIVP